ncbi:hypothetical protein RJT34_20553 [Clitoria ternatea]|uniref:Conserved oligomeric Golgi complex subunit 2 n=1 Tax=Clitoria ternatea TaxID=43366 RepID=A0AAN9IT40_CLITE
MHVIVPSSRYMSFLLANRFSSSFVLFDSFPSEVNNYISFLNHELIHLINRDYTDFTNPSTKVVNVDVVVHMQTHLRNSRALDCKIKHEIYGIYGRSVLVDLIGCLAKNTRVSTACDNSDDPYELLDVENQIMKFPRKSPWLFTSR